MKTCAAWLAISSALVLTGSHRHFYDALSRLDVPELAVGALTGLANLSWYELGYLVGGGLKSVRLFELIPVVGGATGLLCATVPLLRPGWWRPALLVHLSLGLGIAALSLVVLGRRSWHGAHDPWRLVATVAFLAAYAVAFVSVLRARVGAGAGARVPQSRARFTA